MLDAHGGIGGQAPSRASSIQNDMSWPFAVFVTMLISMVLLEVVPGWWLFISLGVWLLPLVWMAVVVLARRRSRACAIGMVALPAAAIALATLPRPADAPVSWLAGAAKTLYYRSALVRQYQDDVRNGIRPALAVITVDGFGSMTSGVAYDPSRELSRPENQRSEQWRAVAANTQLGITGIEARHIVGSYYTWFHP